MPTMGDGVRPSIESLLAINDGAGLETWELNISRLLGDVDAVCGRHGGRGGRTELCKNMEERGCAREQSMAKALEWKALSNDRGNDGVMDNGEGTTWRDMAGL